MTKVKKGKNTLRYLEFLIDSGSDYTMIWQGDALILGLEYKKIKGPETRAEVANLHVIHSKEVRLEIEINDSFIEVPVLISKEPMTPLLGRKGIFDRFEILFQEAKEQVTFIEH